MGRIPPHRWLAALPALLILVGSPFANRVHRLVLGLPFLLLWILGCVLLTSAVMALVSALDERVKPDPDRKREADGADVRVVR